MSLLNSARYLCYGLIANTALKAYYHAPREALQDELFTLHRWALKRAHHARMANRAPNITYCDCGNPAAVRLDNADLCPKCFDYITKESERS